MKPKAVVTAVLSAFVVVSVGAIIVKELRSEAVPVAASVAEQKTSPPAAVTPATSEKTQFVVYYFHGNVRCKTCTAIETQSHEAITTMFADQLRSGEMEWRLVNYDAPENAHFRTDFQLAFQSVVLVEERGGKVLRWENLADVWTKIRENPQEFEEYVVQGAAEFMAGGAS